MLIDGPSYAPSMVKFLNQFSRKCRAQTDDQNKYLASLLDSFFKSCASLPRDGFMNKKNGRFNVALYEAAFASACSDAFKSRRLLQNSLSAEKLAQLASDKEFVGATIEGTTQTKNVALRLDRAAKILGSY
jgi:hypothetical protein